MADPPNLETSDGMCNFPRLCPARTLARLAKRITGNAQMSDNMEDRRCIRKNKVSFFICIPWCAWGRGHEHSNGYFMLIIRLQWHRIHLYLKTRLSLDDLVFIILTFATITISSCLEFSICLLLCSYHPPSLPIKTEMKPFLTTSSNLNQMGKTEEDNKKIPQQHLWKRFDTEHAVWTGTK